jgi:sulfatase maturation enzyme AslB (radical SAM superfamily)
VSYTNSTQTNATHLDDDMLAFLLANDVSIGLSLDGPASLSDASREPRRALPTHSEGASAGARQRARAHATTVDAARRLQAQGREAGADR